MRILLVFIVIFLGGALSAQELYVDNVVISTKSKVPLSGLTSAVCEAASQRARKSKITLETLCAVELKQLLKLEHQMMMFGNAKGPSPLSERFAKIDNIITFHVRDIKGTPSVVVGLSDVQLSEPFGIRPTQSRFREVLKIDKHTLLNDIKDVISRLFDHYEASLVTTPLKKAKEP